MSLQFFLGASLSPQALAPPAATATGAIIAPTVLGYSPIANAVGVVTAPSVTLGVKTVSASAAVAAASGNSKFRPGIPRTAVDDAFHQIFSRLTASEVSALLLHYGHLASAVAINPALRGYGALTDLECNLARAVGTLTTVNGKRRYHAGVLTGGQKAWQVLDALKAVYAGSPGTFLTAAGFSATRARELANVDRTSRPYSGATRTLRAISWPENPPVAVLSAAAYATDRIVKAVHGFYGYGGGGGGSVPNIATLATALNTLSQNGLHPRALSFAGYQSFIGKAKFLGGVWKYCFWDGDFYDPQRHPGIWIDTWKTEKIDGPAGIGAGESDWKYFCQQLYNTAGAGALDYLLFDMEDVQAFWQVWSQGKLAHLSHNYNTGAFGHYRAISSVSDNGAGKCRVTYTAPPITMSSAAGQVVTIDGIDGTPGLNGTFVATFVSSTQFDVLDVPFVTGALGATPRWYGTGAPMRDARWGAFKATLPMTDADDWDHVEKHYALDANGWNWRDGDERVSLWNAAIKSRYIDAFQYLADIALDYFPNCVPNLYEGIASSGAVYPSDEPAGTECMAYGVGHGTVGPYLKNTMPGLYGTERYSGAKCRQYLQRRNNSYDESEGKSYDWFVNEVALAASGVACRADYRPLCWTTYRDYAGSGLDMKIEDGYWEELMCHVAVMGWDFLFYNDQASTDEQELNYAHVIGEIGEVITRNDYAPEVPAIWQYDEQAIITRGDHGGRWLYRVTFDPRLSLSVSPGGDKVVFNSAGKVLTFDRADLIIPSTVYAPVGYWVTQRGLTSEQPDPLTAASSAVAPTVQLGPLVSAATIITAASLATAPFAIVPRQPPVITAASRADRPTVLVGAVAQAAGAITAAATAIEPAVIAGANLVPDVGLAAAQAVAPLVALGALPIEPDAALAASQIVAPLVAVSGVSVGAFVAELAATAVAPSLRLTLIAAPELGTLAASAIEPTVLLSAVSQAAGQAPAQSMALAPQIVLTNIVMSAPILTASVTATAPALALALALAAPSIAASSTLIAPTITSTGANIGTPETVSAVSQAIAPQIQLGAVSVIAPAASAASSVVDTSQAYGIVLPATVTALAVASVLAPIVALVTPPNDTTLSGPDRRGGLGRRGLRSSLRRR